MNMLFFKKTFMLIKTATTPLLGDYGFTLSHQIAIIVLIVPPAAGTSLLGQTSDGTHAESKTARGRVYEESPSGDGLESILKWRINSSVAPANAPTAPPATQPIGAWPTPPEIPNVPPTPIPNRHERPDDLFVRPTFELSGGGTSWGLQRPNTTKLDFRRSLNSKFKTPADITEDSDFIIKYLEDKPAASYEIYKTIKPKHEHLESESQLIHPETAK